MVFARRVWKLLVAVKDGLALLLLLGFFLAIYAVLTARPGAASVENGALLLDLKGAIVEEPAVTSPFAALFGSRAPLREYGVHDVVRGLRLAATDARIKVVVLDLSRFVGAGQVNLTDVGAALDTVRAANKPVLVYSQLYSDDSIQLAAHASEVWIDPFGAAVPTGPGGTHLFYGPLLEKLKITAHVFRVGTFKSAVEPYLRGDMSPEAKENYRALYGALWDNWRADVAKARPKANIALATADPAAWLRKAGGDGAKAALAAGLADRIGDRVQFGDRVAQLAGPNRLKPRPGAFAETPLSTWLAANKPGVSGKTIGVLTIAGDIVPGTAGPGTAGGDRIARLLDETATGDLAALVVRVDSPGGALIAGEQMRLAIARFKERTKIPVVVSMANLTASAGYWVSTPADRIFAEPATITGSIGVFAILPSFERSLASIGVNADGYRTTPLAGQPDVFAGLSPEINDMLQASIEFSYGRFLELVGKSRGKTTTQVDAIAQGRVWDGGSARQLGLVDQFGGLDEALAYSAKAAKIDAGGWHPVFLGHQDNTLMASLRNAFGSEDGDDSDGEAHGLSGMAAARQGLIVRQVLGDLDRLAGTQGVQAYCIECPVSPDVTPLNARESGTLQLLARVLALRTE